MESQNEAPSYTVKTSGFEGPFSLLLDLIEKRKLHISDVSLATVTEDYLAHLQKLGGLPPASVSNFVLVASTLLLIKSKSLLPDLNLTPDEESDIKSLEERLRLFELFTRLSPQVREKFGKKIIFAPLERKNEVLVFLPDDQITPLSMMTLAQELLNSMPKKSNLPEIEVKKVISIEEMIDKLTERIGNSLKLSFRKDFGGSKVEMIVGFLAMLEMIRGGLVNAEQEENDIIIQKIHA